jgi:outer membrane protein assembly factor BamE (lipoprotein component of BamABCDE complex)
MGKAGLKLAALAALALGCACVTTGTKAVTDRQLVSGLQASKTTRAEVFNLLGDPAQVSYPKEGEEVWKYYYITECPRLPELLPILYIFVDGFNQRSQVLTVTFNKDGKVNNLETQVVSGPYQGIPY